MCEFNTKAEIRATRASEAAEAAKAAEAALAATNEATAIDATGSTPNPKHDDDTTTPATAIPLATADNDEDEETAITVSIDGGWQKRGSGRSYTSLSGHVFAVGARTNAVLGRVVYAQKCKMCAVYAKKDADPPEHRCCKNYVGSSKGMEAKGAVELVKGL